MNASAWATRAAQITAEARRRRADEDEDEDIPVVDRYASAAHQAPIHVPTQGDL